MTPPAVFEAVLQGVARPSKQWHKGHMVARAKKAKRDNRVVTYVRMTPEVDAQIAEIVKQRGYPHTKSSVTFEMISKGLQVETATARTVEGSLS